MPREQREGAPTAGACGVADNLSDAPGEALALLDPGRHPLVAAGSSAIAIETARGKLEAGRSLSSALTLAGLICWLGGAARDAM